MKSRILILTAALALTPPAFAVFTDTGGPGQAAPSTWTTIKVTVSHWINYWTGSAAPSTPVAAPATVAQQQRPTTTAPVQAAAAASAPSASTTVPVAATKSTAPVAAQPVATPAPVSAASQEMRKQPLFQNKATGSSLHEVQAVREAVKSAALLKVAKPGRAGTSKLAKSKAGVPTVNWAQLKKVKKVPRLDIGVETLISKEDFTVSHLQWGVQQPNAFKKLPTPAPVNEKELHKSTAAPIAKAFGPRGLQANMRTVGQPLSQEQVDKVHYTLADIDKVKELPYHPLSEEQLKMVAALILFDRGNHCHMIMGMFNRLAEAEKTKIEATYYLGACAAQLKMHQSAFDNLSKVVASENKDFAPDALGLLAKDLLIIYEKDFYKLVKGVKNPKALLNDKNRDDVSYRLAKGAYRAGDYKTSITYAEQVGSGSDFYDDARFMVSMNSFALGDKAGALKKLQELWGSLESRKVSSGNIRALTSLNLARMYFAQKKFNKALEQYMQVPKDHPLWVQALIEQGWTQLAIDDFSGAIGNMYSLHSPYFKAVYQPESFVVRTIGYLNICQYGDAYRTLTYLEKDYRDWYNKTSTYLTNKSSPDDIYATVRNYIRGKSTDDIEGVPYQVWREMAHRKDFLNNQTALNDKFDETKRYEGVNEMIKKEKASIRSHSDGAKKRFDTLRNEIAKATATKASPRKIEDLRNSAKLERDLTIGYRFQLLILEQAREGYLDFQKRSQTNLDRETASLSTKSGQILLTHAKQMQTEMARVLDNNEFLRYEVFAGSGENIRYQVAGGQVAGGQSRVPAYIKPTKMMNWNFDGEFWEDEIGSYRSSLQNNCPMNQQAQQPEHVPTTEQARHVDDDDEN